MCTPIPPTSLPINSIHPCCTPTRSSLPNVSGAASQRHACAYRARGAVKSGGHTVAVDFTTRPDTTHFALTSRS